MFYVYVIKKVPFYIINNIYDNKDNRYIYIYIIKINRYNIYNNKNNIYNNNNRLYIIKINKYNNNKIKYLKIKEAERSNYKINIVI